MSHRMSKLNIDALIFSIGDVLVNVSHSYREVVAQTVQLYLEQAVGLSSSDDPLLTLEEVTLMQKVGNFTNYLDLATALITYFIELLPPVPSPTFPSKYHVPAIMAYLQLAGGRLQIGIDQLREQKDVTKLAQEVGAAGGGPDNADRILPKMNRHLLVEGGEVTKANLVGRIFQELYLGAELFEHVYQQPPVVAHVSGYIQKESLLITQGILAELNENLPLGVVADAPRIEAENSLRANKISQYFQAVITLDEVKAAGARPLPHPWSLLEAARSLQPTPARSAYVGTTPADIQAAVTANETVPFTAIGCLAGAPDKEILRQAFEKRKTHVILGHPDHLKELILG
jgi:phosphoglycolate phosphatase-like HAD superfamily hydrolase